MLVFGILLGILPCLLMKTAIMNRYRERAVTQRTTDVLNQCVMIAGELSRKGYMTADQAELVAGADDMDAALTTVSDIYSGQTLIIDRNFRVVKDSYDIHTGKIIISPEVIRCFQGENTSIYSGESRYVEATVPVTDDTGSEILGAVLISASTDSVENNTRDLDRIMNIYLLIAVIAVILLSLLLSMLAVRPLRKASEALEDFARDSEGGEILNAKTYTEVEDMVTSMNTILNRAKVMDKSRQEFVSNVSHELKTPLTSMKVLADSLIDQEGQVPVELYQEFMVDIAAEIDRENNIINDLLTLVRMDKKTDDLNIRSVNMNELIELLMKRLRPIAETKEVDLVMETFRPVTAEVDEVKMTLALSNLIENAIKYNKPGGWVHVSLNADHKYFYVKVADSGMGIPEEEQEHVFERFYRVDKSHSTQIQGTGLGLAIARSAIVMHRGAVKLHSEVGKGTTFTVRVPLTYVV